MKTMPSTQIGTVPIARWSDPRCHRSPWCLTIYVDGKARRKFFRTEADAQKAWVEHKRLEKKFGTLPYLFDAEAQRRYDTAIRLLAGRATLEEAVRFYLANAQATEKVSLGEAVTRFLTHKGTLGRSSRHVGDLRVRLRQLAFAVGPEQALQFVRSNAVLAWCMSGDPAPRTVKNRRGAAHALFSWCVRRGLMQSNPAEAISQDDMPSPRKSPKELLTVEQTRELLATTQRLLPQCLPWLAVQLFAGVRDAEAGRMSPAMIDIGRKLIRIPAAICKTADDWVLNRLPDNLWPWLDRPDLAFVVPHQRQWRSVTAALRDLPDSHAGRVPRWPYNAARRSFCTYHISLHGDAIATASLLRHQSPARLYASYLGALRDPAIAKEYFALKPQ